MESAEEKRGRELMAQAEASLQKWSWFGSGSKYEDAAELYSKAANNFKVAKRWQLAGEAFVKVAEMSLKTNNQFEAAASYALAAEQIARVDQGAAIAQYRTAISLLSELGRFGTAAKHAEAVADMYEKDGNLNEAVVYFQQAANFFADENSHARAGKSLEKVALHSASLGEFDKAAKGFEKLGSDSMESNLLKFNAKKHFLHAGFCLLAKGDMVASRNAVQRYCDLDYTFKESAECKLLEAMAKAVEDVDADKFADVLYSYDSVRRLDPWETSVLIKVKNAIATAAGDEDDLR